MSRGGLKRKGLEAQQRRNQALLLEGVGEEGRPCSNLPGVRGDGWSEAERHANMR